MFSRVPGTIRQTDEDGEADPPIEPVVIGQPLTNENGEPITDENGETILI